MSGVRIAVALLLAAAGGVVVLLATSAGAAPGKRFHYTHRVVVTGQLVDHWTIDDPDRCGLVGDGTLTFKFRMTTTPKVRAVIDPSHNGEPNNTLGSWILGVPVGGGIGDLPPQPISGTITLVDNTTERPPPSGDCGLPPDKSDCGTTPLTKGAKASIDGYNRRFLVAEVWQVEFSRKGGHGRAVNCHSGEVLVFTDGRITGGTPLKGELLLRMPRASTVAHRRVVHVIGTTHKHSAFTDCGGYACSDDVTRSVTVTLKRL